MMPRRNVLPMVLLSFCPVGQAADWAEFSDLVFLPETSADAQPSPGTAAERVTRARDGDLDEGEAHRARAEMIQARIDEQWESINRTEQQGGPNSPDLIDELETLGALYWELGEYDLAIQSLSRAIEISRRSDGLYSLAQADLIEALIASWSELEAYEEVAELDAHLLRLARRNQDDPRVPHILSEMADRLLDAADRIREEQSQPAFRLSIEVAPIGPPLSGLGPTSPPSPVNQARRLYSEALFTGLMQESYYSDSLLELEDKLVQTYYLELSREEPGAGPRYVSARPSSGGYLYRSATRVLRNRIAHTYARSGTVVDLAAAMIELGDWHLMFSANGKALDHYRFAFDLLVAGDVPHETIESLLEPDVPTMLPAYSDYRELDFEAQPHGYIDVAIEVGRYGQSRDIELLGRSPGTPDIIASRLKRHVSLSRFRPRFVDGELARSDAFSLRYYYMY